MNMSNWSIILEKNLIILFCLLIMQYSTDCPFEKEIKEVDKNISALINELDAAISILKNKDEKNLYFTPEEYFTPSCTQCTAIINLIQIILQYTMSDEKILSYFTKACRVILKYPGSVCSNGVKVFGYDMLYIVKKSDMRSEHICNFLFDNCYDTDRDPRHEWKLALPSTPKPPIIELKVPPANKPKLKVLHITDLHYDPYYQIGSDADCEFPICCRASTGWSKADKNAAGRWGDYRRCDSPKELIENAFQHIVKTHKDLSYIIWTGDIPAHDIWNQTREENLQNLKDTSELINKYFKDTPIFPAVGNHESYPMNNFLWPKNAPPNRNMSYLYDELALQWSQWLPKSTSTDTIKHGAFYSARYGKNFRIISINGNYCSNLNVFLLLNSTDPLDQLSWLITELNDAEKKGEKVQILNHIPPGRSECLKSWSWNFYEIVNRYENTIVTQFHGHTHFDEFRVFYDTKDFKRPVGIGYIGPALTPWIDCNPAYRIYHVDGDYEGTTGMVLDHETWSMDIAQANKNDKPVWKKTYEAKKMYKMTSLFPKDWDNLIKSMSNDTKLFDSYFKNYLRAAATIRKCKKECREELLCDLRTGRSHDRDNLCKNLI